MFERITLATAVIIVATLGPVQIVSAEAAAPQKAILITGASTGIGLDLAEELAELNADHPYSYSDEELIQILTAATAAQRK